MPQALIFGGEHGCIVGKRNGGGKTDCVTLPPMAALNTLLFCAGVLALFVLNSVWGWALLGLGVLHLYFCGRTYRRTILLAYLAVSFIGLTRMHTDLGLLNTVRMGIALPASFLVPYFITRYVYKERFITFPVQFRGIWSVPRVLYIVLGVTIAYFLIPFYLHNTGAWQNWHFERNAHDLFALLMGMLLVGAWDELFFVNTIMRLFQSSYRFVVANLIQAVVFGALLFDLGFRGWGLGMIFLFALIQGYTYHRTQSLVYLITVHLCIDTVLFLAMVQAHYPALTPIFIIY